MSPGVWMSGLAESADNLSIATVADRESLSSLQQARLAAMLREVTATNQFYRDKLGLFDLSDFGGDVSVLPFTTREELQADQDAHPPYGTNLTYPLERYTRCHQTSGSKGRPLRWLDTAESWRWWLNCWRVIFDAAELGPADRVLFPFSFGPFIGFWAAFEGAAAMGMLAVSGGGLSTAARLRALMEHDITAICCTPTYAMHMGEVARDEGIDLPGCAVRALIVAGEPGGHIPATRARIERDWGARVFDHCGMTEIGPWGFELASDPGAMRVMEQAFIAEVIDPETEELIDEGMAGELVLTNLGRWGSPLIRYRTGDRVVLTRDEGGGCCLARVAGGVTGRLDDMLFIRGNNVFPSAIEEIVRRHEGVAEFRLVVRSRGAMTQLGIEIEPSGEALGDELAEAVGRAIRDRLHFGPEVVAVAPGSLPRFELKSSRVVRL